MSGERDEARAILGVTASAREALSIVESQLNVLYTRAQVLVSLAGVMVTVTGFSGRIIAGTDGRAQALLIVGLVLVLLAAMWVFATVMTIRWVTGSLTGDTEADLAGLLRRRNRKTRAYMVGGFILFVGLALYVWAIAIMLANPGASSLSPR